MRLLSYIFILIALFIAYSCRKNECIQTGDSMPEFSSMDWINGPKQSIQNLKNMVVLIRWWTDDCIFCINSADALNEWYAMYNNKGLEVLGIYHVKPINREVSTEEIREFAREKNFYFPIGIDKNWINLNKYWNNCDKHEFTSISILLDKSGKIRYIHPGGSYQNEKQNEKQNETASTTQKELESFRDYRTIDSLIRVLIVE